MINDDDVYILDSIRTPIGFLLGKLSQYSAIELGEKCASYLCKKYDLYDDLDLLIVGNVISAGLGLNMSKSIIIKSNINENTVSYVLNRACGSGLDIIINGYDLIKLKKYQKIMTIGTESMSNVPYSNKYIRKNNKYGNIEIDDLIENEGLTDYISKKTMLEIANEYCNNNNISKKEQNDYAIRSYNKSLNNTNEKEILEINNNNNDECPQKFDELKLLNLKPIINNGSITAGNCSKIADGSTGLILVSGIELKKMLKIYKINHVAKIIDTNIISGNVLNFVESPVKSIKNILKKNNLQINDIDLFEINEAFACVPIICQKNLDINIEKINISGGGISLGHPLANSGSKIVSTLFHNLYKYNKKYGCASICVGTGGASTILIENINL